MAVRSWSPGGAGLRAALRLQLRAGLELAAREEEEAAARAGIRRLRRRNMSSFIMDVWHGKTNGVSNQVIILISVGIGLPVAIAVGGGCM